MKKKVLLVLFTLTIILNLSIPIYADDELEEINISQEEIDKIVETSVDVSDIPKINSRNAVVYDRTSRNNSIWETRE